VCTTLGDNLVSLDGDEQSVAGGRARQTRLTWLGRLAIPIPSTTGAREAIEKNGVEDDDNNGGDDDRR
jgi:hypothetical protein